ncbi:MAG: riboflavin biosynthesis protein RibF [Gaiellaceae bacterium]
MRVARLPQELPRGTRAVAIGSFDGLHRGHQRVLDEAFSSGLEVIAVTFDPHPRAVLGRGVELLSTLERRLELLAEYGLEETLVIGFDLGIAALSPQEFIERFLLPMGTEVVVAGPDFRFGHGRAGDLDLLRRQGFLVRAVPPLPGVSSTTIRQALLGGDVVGASALLGRPPELEGTVVSGDARGATLGFPTANLAVPEGLLVPPDGVYAAFAAGHRVALSIGTNPHFDGQERRIEAFLLDFEGDLYGERLVVQLWQRLRDQQTFSSDRELTAQIARDVEAVRAAELPAVRSD